LEETEARSKASGPTILPPALFALAGFGADGVQAHHRRSAVILFLYGTQPGSRLPLTLVLTGLSQQRQRSMVVDIFQTSRCRGANGVHICCLPPPARPPRNTRTRPVSASAYSMHVHA